MKKVLKFTAGATWFMMKTLIKAAWRLPGLIHRMAEHHQPVTTSKPREMPSPATAFPAP